MSVLRVEHPQQYQPGTFFRMPHAAARDAALSFDARGVLSYLISRGSGWRLTTHELRTQGLSRAQISRITNELEDCGYITRHQRRDPQTKRFGEVTWTVNLAGVDATRVPESRSTENRTTENRDAASRATENQQESVNPESANPLSENQVKENQSSVSAHAPTDDDDFVFSLPADFGKLTKRQRAALTTEVTRLGAERVREVVARVQQQDSVRRKLPYLLTALKNESETVGTSTPPSSARPPLLSGKYADFVERGDSVDVWNMPTPSPDVYELASESGDAADDEPPQYSQREADMFCVAIDQLKHQLDRGTFEAYVMGLKLIRSENGGKRLVLQSKSPNALEMLRGRLYRNLQAVIHDCVNLSCPRAEFELVFESAPVEMPSRSWLAGVGA